MSAKATKALLAAAEKGDRVAVARALDQGADVNARGGEYQQSALHFAAMCGDAALVELLLARGAAVDTRDKNEDTPLHQACQYSGARDMIERLLDAGAEVNARDNYDQRPLQLLASHQPEQLLSARLLLERGADPKAKSRLGSMIALAGGRAMKKLLEDASGAAKTKTKAPPAVDPRYGAALAPVARLLGKVCRVVDERSDTKENRAFLFDWTKVKDKHKASFLGDVFNDGIYEKYMADDEDSGAYLWTHATVVPFAVLGDFELEDIKGGLGELGWSDAILLFDLKKGKGANCPVLRVDIDGTVDPASAPKKIANGLAELRLRKA
jgi:ankyrin repeat protein